jgi:hypothetical protein
MNLDRHQLRELASQAGLIFIGTLDFNEGTTRALVSDPRDPHRRFFLSVDFVGVWFPQHDNEGQRPTLNVIDPLPRSQIFGGP